LLLVVVVSAWERKMSVWMRKKVRCVRNKWVVIGRVVYYKGMSCFRKRENECESHLVKLSYSSVPFYFLTNYSSVPITINFTQLISNTTLIMTIHKN
jgi:hypothetical protein